MISPGVGSLKWDPFSGSGSQPHANHIYQVGRWQFEARLDHGCNKFKFSVNPGGLILDTQTMRPISRTHPVLRQIRLGKLL